MLSNKKQIFSFSLLFLVMVGCLLGVSYFFSWKWINNLGNSNNVQISNVQISNNFTSLLKVEIKEEKKSSILENVGDIEFLCKKINCLYNILNENTYNIKVTKSLTLPSSPIMPVSDPIHIVFNGRVTISKNEHSILYNLDGELVAPTTKHFGTPSKINGTVLLQSEEDQVPAYLVVKSNLQSEFFIKIENHLLHSVIEFGAEKVQSQLFSSIVR